MPLTIALVNQCDVVREGLRSVLARHPIDAELVAVERPADLRVSVDLALYDPDAPLPRGADPRVLPALVRAQAVAHPVAFAPRLDRMAVDTALAGGAHGVVSTRLKGPEIADAFTRVAEGAVVVAMPHRNGEPQPGSDWPGRALGVTAREGEILILAAQGLSNPEIARNLFLSPETVKSYMSSVFTKLGFRNRVEATAYVLHTAPHLAATPTGRRRAPVVEAPDAAPTPEA